MVGDGVARLLRIVTHASRVEPVEARPCATGLAMRILITNDDGVFAPGIAALARGLSAAFGSEHDLFVVAPLTDHSGTSSAVGRVYERESIPYESVEIPGLARVPTFGIDGTPALAVILACIERLRTSP